MKEVELIPNLKDDNHCFQACFAMVAEAFTERRVSMADAEFSTGFVTNRPTWPYRGILSWAENGLFVRYVERFSHFEFIADPQKTIREHLNDDGIANFVISVSDLDTETATVKSCLAHPRIQFDIASPTLDDIKEFLGKGALVVVNVNYFALLGPTNKYVGHFVVVQGIDSGSVVLQNPGLPPIPNQQVSFEDFLRAWHYPNEKLANIIAVSPKPI